ncbi:hypothetical protein [Pyxidicoccus sp. MSG2]|uniref:hypothetical protein n=1 Tax=Pyxidicoccus sp. MSG2 TaxID=2996790 RepID=UPI002271E443|nr:hypothetical protein [Pyxidicoccus sp. MSG2]MCY1022945.1 hypothetical protein [Pyxidicoccus sp. MSG2]
MNIKTILAAVVLVSALAASDSRADPSYDCSLSVSPSSYILLGQSFSYDINIPFYPSPGPFPPGYQGVYQRFTVVFYGPDLPASGETYPGTFGYWNSQLTGYQNPSTGGASGTYLRYATFYYYPTGTPYCTTNTVAVVLQ